MGAPGLRSTAVLKWNRFRAPPRGVTRAEARTHPQEAEPVLRTDYRAEHSKPQVNTRH